MQRLFFIALAVFTASVNVQAQNAERAKKLLNEVSSKVKNYNNIDIEFRYTLRNVKENVNQETRGSVKLKGEKYLLNMLGATQLFDGKKLHTIVPEDEEITISTATNEEENITPSKMLSFYEKGYTYKWDIVQNVQGRKIQYVELKPTEKNSDIKDILLGIDSETKHIYKLIQRQTNGTEITITLTSFKTNQPMAESQFVFDKSKYSGYYINNL